jgi:hypothetical protein
MARSIDDIYLKTLPFNGYRSRGDGDSPFTLLLHPVHNGVPVIDLSHPMDETAVEENSLGRRRLSSIDMRHYTDISYFFERIRFIHTKLFLDITGDLVIPLCSANHCRKDGEITVFLRRISSPNL